MIDLYVTLFRDQWTMNRTTENYQIYKKLGLVWPGLPNERQPIQVGSSGDDSFNVYMKRIFFSSYGNTIVEAELENAGDEFNELCRSLEAGGFTQL
jgi:hypothetical protein